jgi:valyl-tRNA synthetase
MPFVTEEVWSFMPGDRDLLAASAWPEPNEKLVDAGAEETVGRVIEAVTELRRFREEVGAKASVSIPARISGEGYEEMTAQMARLTRFEFVADGAEPGSVLFELPVPGGVVEILRSDAFDADEAVRRIGERVKQLEAEIARGEGKLSNERFVDRAPAEVVDAEREKLAGYRDALERVRAWTAG